MARAKKSKTTQEEEVQMTQETPEAAGAEAAPVEAINLQDLKLLAAIVNLASKRGAFQANEMSQVGATYDKLVTFLQQISVAQEDGQENAKEE
jgi:hypothetical protein